MMSIFKIREFWSFDLNSLAKLHDSGENCENSLTRTTDSEMDCGRFVVDLGVFHSIGSHQVFVCGNIQGTIYIIQVPRSKQPKCDQSDKVTEESPSGGQSVDSLVERQLLLVKQLGYPIVDLKCGFYTSTIKQSIAVLSLNELVVYQVKQIPVDLMSQPGDDFNHSNLLNHGLEEHHRILMVSNEIPVSLLTLDNRADRSSGQSVLSKVAVSEPKPAQRTRLPQRDLVAIQYTDQSLYTLVDHKRIIGHFRFLQPFLASESVPLDRDSGELSASDVDQAEQRGRNVKAFSDTYKFAGPVPATYLMADARMPSLAISFTDGQVYCLPLMKLISTAKQSVIKRVAENLVGRHQPEVISGKFSGSSSTESDHPSEPPITPVQIDLVQTWNLELSRIPLRMINVPQPIGTLVSGHESAPDQLLIVARYSLDLLSASGQHLWSHRFEAPIRCLSNHSTISCDGYRTNSHIVCEEYQEDGLSAVSVISEEKLVWSALVASKPIKIWNARLSSLTGALALMTDDSDGLNLRVGYFGTHTDEIISHDLDANKNFRLSQLRDLDEPLDAPDDQLQESLLREDVFKVEVSLEAKDSWPKVQVNFKIRISLRSSVAQVLNNISAFLEFDDLLHCTLLNCETVHVNSGVISTQLGNCWPDRRDPMVLSGYLSMRNYSHIDQQSSRDGPYLDENLLPKSLQVRLMLRFTSAQTEEYVQQESFLLPLSLIATLEHADYSIGNNQSLSDILTNLPGYKRSPSNERTDIEDGIFNSCSIVVSGLGDIVDILDEIIESDLVCRGMNSESSTYKRFTLNRDQKINTMESFNLLAQSLDCRLKYKNVPRHMGMKKQQSSLDEYQQVVLISIAFTIPTGNKVFMNGDESASRSGVVWVHLCDLDSENTQVGIDFALLQMRDWKFISRSSSSDFGLDTRASTRPVLLTMESVDPLPSLYVCKHLIDRLKSRSRKMHNRDLAFKPFFESDCDKLELDPTNFRYMRDSVIFNLSLHDRIKDIITQHSTLISSKMVQLKRETQDGHNKLHLASMACLSASKRLHDLPVDMHNQFSELCALVKKYYLNQMRLVGELERLKRLDYHYCKVPNIEEIWVETRKVEGLSELQLGLNFARTVD